MKSFELLLFFYLVPLFTIAQTETERNSITATSFVTDKSGNFYITGNFEGVIVLGRHTLLSKGKDDIFIAKYSSDGSCIWATSAGGKEADYSNSISVDDKGNTYIAGKYSNNAMFDLTTLTTDAFTEFFIAKYNPSGDLLYVQKADSPKNSDNRALGIYVTESGDCYVGATFNLPSKIDKNVFQGNYLLKFNSSLKFVNGNKIGGEINAITGDKSGNIYFIGDFSSSVDFCKKTYTSKGATDIFISKFTGNGNCAWTRQLGNISAEIGKNITVDRMGNLIVVGVFKDSISDGNYKVYSKGQTDVLIAKYASDGNLIWMKSGGGEQYDNVSGVYTDESGSIYVTGKFIEYAAFGNTTLSGLNDDAFIVKYNSKGESIFGKAGTNNNFAEGIAVSSDNNGNITFLGNFNQSINFDKKSLFSNSGGNCIFIVKINAKGDFISLVKGGEADMNFEYDPNALYTNVNGKLLVGKDVMKPLPNQPVSIIEPSGNILQSTVTDVFGDFSFKNIDSKKSYSIDLNKNESIPEGEPIYLAKQTGEVVKSVFRNKDGNFKFEFLPKDINTLSLMPVEDPVISLKNFIKGNDETEKVITDNIYYPQDSYILLPEAKQKINQIIKPMKTNKNLYLEISSFTDSRGDDNYNLELSKKRALEVSKYIVSQGIPSDRVLGNGYGETKILNRCINNIEDCSEKEHYLNRRTEFKFIKR